MNGTADALAGQRPRPSPGTRCGCRPPLAPGDSVELAFTWHYDVSRQPGREGMIDSTTYFLAYFYPRVAVYDDTDGWDTMDHTGPRVLQRLQRLRRLVQALPGFLVWGTGTLETASDVLQPEYLRRYQASLTSDTDGARGHGGRAGRGRRHRATTRSTCGASPSRDVPGRGLRRERPLRLGRGERGGGSSHGAPCGRTGGVQRLLRRLPPHGALRPRRPGLVLPELAGRALPVREDHRCSKAARGWSTR